MCRKFSSKFFIASLALPYGLEPRITDGEDAVPGEFPYQVSVQYGLPPILPFSHICGGSILNKNHVITAGHCIINRLGKLRVIAGKHVLLETESTEQVVDVAKSYVHEKYPGYVFAIYTIKNQFFHVQLELTKAKICELITLLLRFFRGVAPYDIAVLKLSTHLIFNERVSAVNLPQQNEVRIGNVVLSGWGSTSKNLLPTLPKVLQKATIPLLDNQSCLKKLEIVGSVQLYDSQICTDAVKETSACSGDSGGPLVQFDGNNPTQLGIVSWGVYPCGVSGSPSVYTRVSSYVDWIEHIVNA
ncbi:trypsin-1-like [Linepithema humile]|uniref:trypsin-1-like n=1 Tax=Linepithema humile TaxID=83485 RepID=UPI00351E7E6A